MSKDNNFSFLGFLVWGMCAIFFLYEFLLRTVTGTFQHPIMYDLELTTLKFSLLSSTVYLFIYGIMQIPVGIIVDHIGLKKSLTIGALLCAVASFGFSCSPTYITAMAFRMLMGLGSAFGFICLLVSVYEWMPKRYIGMLIGLSQFIGTLGPMLAAGPLEHVARNSSIDWRMVFQSLGYAGIVISLFIIFIVKNNKSKNKDTIILKRPEPAFSSIKRLFMGGQPWFIALFSACTYFAIEYLSENEGINYIALKGHGNSFASYMITTSWLAYAIGCLSLGAISDLMQRRKIVMIIAASCSVLSISLLLTAQDKNLITLAFVLLGLGAGGQSIGFALIAEHFSKKFLAVGLALNNAMITTISAINAPAIGKTLDYIKSDISPNLSEYNSAFTILLVLSIAALILSIFFIKESFCKSKVEFTYLKI